MTHFDSSSMQEKLLTRLIHQNRLLFTESNPYVPEACAPSNDLKRRLKAESSYELQESNKKPTIGTK